MKLYRNVYDYAIRWINISLQINLKYFLHTFKHKTKYIITARIPKLL